MARKRGRPSVYIGPVKRHIVSLIRRYGLTGAMKRLNARAKTVLSRDRNTNLIPKPLGISLPTLGGYAKEANITLYRGRPVAA